MKWEYRVITLSKDNREAEAALDKLGLEGWELVGVESTWLPFRDYFARAYLKRLMA